MRVAVVGAGAMGSAAAWRLAARGADVVCFDRHSPPHELGSSHGETRITRTAYFEGAWYVPLLQETFPMWRQLEKATGSQVLTVTGLLTLGAPDSEPVVGALASARQHGLPTTVLDAAETQRLHPGHVMDDGDVAVVDAEAGLVRPEAAIEAMLRNLDVRRGTAVTGVDGDDRHVQIATSSTRETFDAAVVCAGPWARELLPSLPVTVERQVAAWLEVEPGTPWLIPARFPVYLRETAEFGDLYGFPSLDGSTVKLARHHGGEQADPDHLRRQVDDADLDPLRGFAARWLRGVTGRVARTSVCMYTNTPDGHFVIDLHPASNRVVVVSACSGHGFKFAPVIGDIAADLALDGGTRRDIARFSWARFESPVA
jgi:sarcosine oxidase